MEFGRTLPAVLFPFQANQFSLDQGIDGGIHILFAQSGQPHNSRTGDSRLGLDQAQNLVTLGRVVAEGDTSIVRLGVESAAA